MITKTIKVTHNTKTWSTMAEAMDEIVEAGSVAYVDALTDIKASGLVTSTFSFDAATGEMTYTRSWDDSALAEFENQHGALINNHRQLLESADMKIIED